MIESDSANVVTTVQIKHQTLSRLGPIYGEIRKAQNILGHVRFVKVPRGQNRTAHDITDYPRDNLSKVGHGRVLPFVSLCVKGLYKNYNITKNKSLIDFFK
jgi:hypothetical protein